MSSASSSPPAKAEPAAKSRPAVPWNSWLAVLFVVAIFYGSQFVSGFLVTAYTLLRGWSETEAMAWLENSVPAQFVYVLVAEVLAVGAIYLFLRIHKSGWGSIGLRRPRWSDPVYGLAALPVYFMFYLISLAVLTYFLPGLDINQEQQIGFENVQGSTALILTFISLVILPPIAEEILVRGFLYTTLKKALPIAAAVILTSAAFAIAHLPAGGPAGPLYVAAVDTFILSLVLIYLREKTGGLWASITLHALKNGIAFTAIFILHLR